MEHCCNNYSLPDYQSAYREGYSCETVLVKYPMMEMEEQELTALIAINLSASFYAVYSGP